MMLVCAANKQLISLFEGTRRMEIRKCVTMGVINEEQLDLGY